MVINKYSQHPNIWFLNLCLVQIFNRKNHYKKFQKNVCLQTRYIKLSYVYEIFKTIDKIFEKINHTLHTKKQTYYFLLGRRKYYKVSLKISKIYQKKKKIPQPHPIYQPEIDSSSKQLVNVFKYVYVIILSKVYASTGFDVMIMQR